MLLTSVALGWILAGAPMGRAQAPSEQVSPQAAKLIAQGDAQAKKLEFNQAYSDYKKADEAATHACVTCLLRMATAARKMGDLGKAADAAKRAVAAAQDKPGLLVTAASQAGDLFAAQAGFGPHPNKKHLAQAEAAYRAALTSATAAADRGALRFKLGVILIREGRQSDGTAELQAAEGAPGVSPDQAWQAKEILANPKLAYEMLTPNFSVTANDGETYSAPGLRGKVVLLDFWGSWCPPCRESAPMLVQVRARFAKKSDFVMLGIDTDDTVKQMKEFADAHHMTWPEFFDAQMKICDRFGVHEFPTFLVMRRDGSVAYLSQGLAEAAPGQFSPDTRRAIEDAIQEAIKN